VLPVSVQLVQGYLWVLLQRKYRVGSIQQRIYAILDRHSLFGLVPAFGRKQVRGWMQVHEQLFGSPLRKQPGVGLQLRERILLQPRVLLRHLLNLCLVELGNILLYAAKQAACARHMLLTI
jgi:hypothetical protein